MWLTVVIVLILLAIIAYRSCKRPPNYPPGPMKLPFIGNMLSVDLNKSGETFYNWYKKYGKIYSVSMGASDLVILNDPLIIKKALYSSDFLDRPQTYGFMAFTLNENAGISTSSGEVWHEHRKFTLRHLRDFGFGKSKTEEYVKTEIENHIEKLKQKDGQVIELTWDISVAITNVIWRLISGIRMDSESKEMQRFTGMMKDFFISFGDIFFLDSFPWILKLVPKAFLKGVKKFEGYRDIFYDFFRAEIAQHKKDFKKENEDRDLIDSYIRRIKEESLKPGFNEKFEETNLEVIIGDLFSAGGETTYTTLRWAFIALVKYPEVQRKIQEEMKNVIGDRLPDLSDRESLVYMEAFIMEVHRFCSLIITGVPHSNNTRDVNFMGYTIPKGTQIIPNVYVCHTSPEFWDKPEKFMPERFIDENGKIHRPDAYMPFGIGRRACPGEILAATQLFLTIGSLLQKFNFEAFGEVTFEPESEVIVRYPKPYKMIIRVRE